MLQMYQMERGKTYWHFQDHSVKGEKTMLCQNDKDHVQREKKMGVIEFTVWKTF